MFHELIVIDDPTPRPGPLNMAIDEVLLPTARPAILRFYRWNAPSVSFGYFVRFAEARETAGNRDVVRRWTGGGIVPHSEDLFDHDRSAGWHLRTAIERNLSASAFDAG